MRKPVFEFFAQITQSSILNSLFVVSILVFFLGWVLRKEKNYKYFRTDFIGIVVVLIVARLFLPIECFYTWSIRSKAYGDLHYYVLTAPFFNTGLEVKQVLVLIWIVGSLIQLVRYGIELYQMRFMEKFLLFSDQPGIKSTMTTYRIVESEYVKQPQVTGFTQTIYLPKVDFTEQELKYIVLHESRHLKNRDLIWLQLVNLLRIIYWWFPLVHVFQKQFQFLLEIRVDYQVSSMLEESEYLDYAKAMIEVNKKIEEKKPKYTKSLGFSNFEKSELSHRITFYLEGEKKKKTSKFLLTLLLVFGIGSSVFILEPYYPERAFGENNVGANDSYLLEKKDGTYEWYVKDELYDVLDREVEIEAVKEGKLEEIPIRKE